MILVILVDSLLLALYGVTVIVMSAPTLAPAVGLDTVHVLLNLSWPLVTLRVAVWQSLLTKVIPKSVGVLVMVVVCALVMPQMVAL